MGIDKETSAVALQPKNLNAVDKNIVLQIEP